MKRLALISLVPLVVAGLTMLIAPLAGATKATIPPYSAVFSKGTTPLKTLALTAGEKVDVVWKDGTCSNGYVTPPVVMTWSGPTVSGGVTDPTAAPVIPTCSSIKWPDDFECQWLYDSLGHVNGFSCGWTYKKAAGSSTARTIPNPQNSENSNLFLYNRTVLYAQVQQPGTKTWTKVTVPAGANAVHIVGPNGG